MGRPRALDAEKKTRILDYLTRGLSRFDAAARVHVVHTTIANEAERDPEFLASLKDAEIDCKLFHLDKIRNAKRDTPWQASAWFLERKWPEEFGKAEYSRVDFGDKKGNRQMLYQVVSNRMTRVAANAIAREEAIKKHGNGDGNGNGSKHKCA